MAPRITLAAAELAGTMIETLILGPYLLVFLTNGYFMLRRTDPQQPRTFARTLKTSIDPVRIASAVIFLCIISHWVLNITRMFDAFVHGQDGSPDAFYRNTSDGKYVAKSALYGLEVICADFILIYRLYVVWSHSWKICALPAIATLTTLGMGVAITYLFSAGSVAGNPFASILKPLITGFFSTTLLVNLYSCCLIAYRLWRSYASVRQFDLDHPSSVPRILQIIIESAAIYTVCTLVTLIAYLWGSNIQASALNLTSPVIGFAFCLITVRIRLRDSTYFHRTDCSSHVNELPAMEFSRTRIRRSALSISFADAVSDFGDMFDEESLPTPKSGPGGNTASEQAGSVG